MGKRRYSEEFYREIDNLIRQQYELSEKRRKDIAIIFTGDDFKGKAKEVSKSLAPPTFWEIARKNNLFKVTVSLLILIVLVIVMFSYVSIKYEKRKRALEVVNLTRQSAFSRKKKKVLTNKEARVTLRFSPPPNLKEWGEVQEGASEVEKPPKELLSSSHEDLKIVKPTNILESIPSNEVYNIIPPSEEELNKEEHKEGTFEEY